MSARARSIIGRNEVRGSERSGTLGRGFSWVALLAASTVGQESVFPMRARIQGKIDFGEEAVQQCRLVVQSLPGRLVGREASCSRRVRALGSVQRSVTMQELGAGLCVQLLQVGAPSLDGRPPVLRAWVEPGAPNLEYDGLTASPGPRAVVAVWDGTVEKPIDQRERSGAAGLRQIELCLVA